MRPAKATLIRTTAKAPPRKAQRFRSGLLLLLSRTPETPAVETPRLILPFTTSIALRQDPTASTDDTAPQEAAPSTDDATTPDTATAAPLNSLPVQIPTNSRTPAILPDALVLGSLPRVGETRTNSAAGGTQVKAQAKLQTKLQAKLQDKPQDLVLTVAANAPFPQTTTLDQSVPAGPAIPVLPVTSSTTFEQTATGAQNSSEVNEAPDIISPSASDRGIAYQYRSSNERPAESAVINRASGQPQKELEKVLDSTQAFPIPATNTPEPQLSIHPLTGSSTPRKDAAALQSNSAVTQDSSTKSETDPKTAAPLAIERANDTADAPSTGTLAFAARLTPTAELQPPASDSAQPVELLQGSPAAPQLAVPITAKQIAAVAELPSEGHSGDGAGQSDKEKTSEGFAGADTLLSQMRAPAMNQTTFTATNNASISPLSPAARVDQVPEPPATPSRTNHDITIRIPDATDQGTAVRFVERAGEIHVSVRTGDAEMAQSLRGGLNDLVNRLEDGGIRTEVWQPGADHPLSQNDSQQPFADPDGSNGRQYSSGSNSEQESKQQNKPRWVEELEGSIGNQDPKETPQYYGKHRFPAHRLVRPDRCFVDDRQQFVDRQRPHRRARSATKRHFCNFW